MRLNDALRAVSLRQIYDSGKLGLAQLPAVTQFLQQQVPLRLALAAQAAQAAHPLRYLHEACVETAAGCHAAKDSVELQHELEATSERLTRVLRVTVDETSKAPAAQQAELQRGVDTAFYTLIGLRTLAAHHGWLVHQCEGEPAVQLVDLHKEVSSTIDDARGLVQEKYGACPEVELRPARSSVRFIGVSAYVHFVVMELLKNSLRATVESAGPLEADRAPAVTIDLEPRSTRPTNYVAIMITDAGGGWNARTASEDLFTYGRTSAHGRAEPDYRYSREFGVPLAGQGVGLAVSRLHCRFMGGSLTLQNVPDHGVVAVAYFNKHGHTSDLT